MSDLVVSLGANPIALVAAIILTTFVLEDAASIGAALLAAGGALSTPLAMTALVLGIFAGDLGLYGLGYAARSQLWARKRIADKHIEQGRRWLNKRLPTALIVARFIPGARLPAYVASGYLRVPLARFAAITAGAGIVWTIAVFAVVLSIGPDALIALGAWKWLIGAALLVLLLAAPRLIERNHV
jgi:membrane protein DedA with SNARE-associated domain